MKLSKFIIFMLVLATSAGCGKSAFDEKIAELDNELSSLQEYFDKFEEKMSVLKDSVRIAKTDSAKWALYYSIVEKYSIYSIDSMYVYSLKMQAFDDAGLADRHFHTEISTVSTMFRQGRLVEAAELLEKIDTGALSPFHKGEYFSQWASYYDVLGEKEKAWNHKLLAIKYLPSDDIRYVRYHGHNLLNHGKTEEARKVFFEALDKCRDIRNVSYITYGIAKTYLIDNDRDNYKLWLVETCIWDTRAAVKESDTMRKLAMVLLEDGDVSRASKYIKTVLQNNHSCNFSARINETLKYEQLVAESAAKVSRKNIMLLSIIIALVSSGVVLIFIMYTKLKHKSRELKLSNNSLSILNRTMEEYLTRHMILSVQNIGKTEEYRKMLLETLKNDKEQGLLAVLKRPCLQRDEFTTFNRNFDESFLSIYPDFLNEVNSLLKDGFKLQFNDDGTMPNQLRILATLRLGFKNSSEIAAFLNLAPRSVYTYRSKLKQHSIFENDEFEERIIRKYVDSSL